MGTYQRQSQMHLPPPALPASPFLQMSSSPLTPFFTAVRSLVGSLIDLRALTKRRACAQGEPEDEWKGRRPRCVSQQIAHPMHHFELQ